MLLIFIQEYLLFLINNKKITWLAVCSPFSLLHHCFHSPEEFFNMLKSLIQVIQKLHKAMNSPVNVVYIIYNLKENKGI